MGNESGGPGGRVTICGGYPAMVELETTTCVLSSQPAQSFRLGPSTQVAIVPPGLQKSSRSGLSGSAAATMLPSGESEAAELIWPQSRVLQSVVLPDQSMVPPWMQALPAGLSGPLALQAPIRTTAVGGFRAAPGE